MDQPLSGMRHACRASWVLLSILITMSAGCDGKPRPVKPAPAMSPEEKKEFEARISRVIDQERKQRQEQLREPVPPPESR